MTQERNGVYRRGNGWGFRFSYRDGNGVRRWVRRQGFATKAEARAAYAKVTTETNRNGSSSPNLTVGDYLVGWVERYERSQSRKVTTVRTTKVHVTSYLVPRLGSVRLSKLTPSMVANLYADLLENGRSGRAGRGGLSPKTVQNIGGTLGKALSDAVRDGLIPKNPAANLDRPRWVRPEMHVYNEAEVAEFLRYAQKDGDPLAALWRLVFAAGLRRGELCGLRWKDVDLVGGYVSIVQTRVHSGKVHVSSPKTRAALRQVSIDPETVTALALLKNAHDDAATRLGGWTSDLVATDLDGKPIHPERLTERFHRTSRGAGLPPIRLHDARHTHATVLFDHGAPVHVVSRRLGHTSVAFTADVYVAHVKSADRAAADLWSSLLGAAERVHDDA